MRQYIDVLQDQNGNALVGATCTVLTYPGGANASIYSDNGLTPIANSTVTSGADGSFAFFVADGDYQLQFAKNSTVYKTQAPVSIFDGAAQVTKADISGTVNLVQTSDSALEKALRTGLRAWVTIANTNTGATTFSYNGLAAKSIVNPGGAALSAGQLIAGAISSFEYNGTAWQLYAPPAPAFYAQTAAEATAGITPTAYQYPPTPVYNMARYGISSNLNGTVVDNSAIVQAVFNMAKVTGGTIVFPYGDYSFYLDISGQANAVVTIDGQGSTFRPYTSNPINSCTIFCDNHTSTLTNWYSSQVTFRNCLIAATKYVPGVATGDVNYCVYMRATAAKFYNCIFYYGAIASVYGLYAQYAEFWSCDFTSATAASNSAGCLLDSNTLAASSNEVLFNRCEFFSNSIGLWLKGAQKTRIWGVTVQGNSVAGIQLDQDSSGSATTGTMIRDGWFELNTPGSNIIGNICVDTTMDGCIFWATGGTNQIYFSHCDGVNFLNCSWQGGGTPVISLQHPNGNTDTVSITWRGNVSGSAAQTPTVLGIGHPGPYNLDLHWEYSFTGTLTGCSGTNTATVYATVEGNCVDLRLPNLTATSNTTACTLTGLPAILAPATLCNGIAPIVNNGTPSAQLVEIAAGGTTVIAFQGGSTTGFTATGTKGFTTGVFRYPLFL